MVQTQNKLQEKKKNVKEKSLTPSNSVMEIKIAYYIKV